MFLGA